MIIPCQWIGIERTVGVPVKWLLQSVEDYCASQAIIIMRVLYVRNMAGVICDSVEERERLIASLTLYNKFDGSTLQLFNTTLRQSSALGLEVPVGYISQPVDINPDWQQVAINYKGNLRSEQRTLVESYLDNLKLNGLAKSGGILQSPTGSGKTVMAVNILTQIGLKALIIVPTDYLMGQWRKQLKRFSNLTDDDIGICRGTACQYKNKKVVIGMIHSLARPHFYPPEFYNCFGLCIVDEVHRLSAPTFSQSLPQFWTKYRLGLSATARRKDGMENVFLYHIGQICNPEVKQAIKPRVIVMKYYNPESHHAGCVWAGKLSLGRYFNKLSIIEHRNKFITDIIYKLYHKGKDTLVLSDRLMQVGVLSDLLIAKGINVEDIGIFTGKRKAGLDRKILLATYGSAGLGADIPRLSAIVFATPRADIEQAAGRVLREKQETPQVIIDIVDTSSHIMVGWGKARMKYYKKITDNIKEV